ncbi:MAG: lipoyl(octanoyl) transferase LipB [Deltaproteobacteria bacterium]|nr:lipoyl(octanoyl) transferase LipB [Deltaproteobacteria bacterium]MBW1977511.1 lipoyl(octanoyl) transferase LipB [Deltaproteobacteria bacterium]MBW2043922.1 lipoyl(octanoyl) transferase LipB [Deltaproteobacteria bacterium]MBW2299596.1 lipoyl(octanoyl) transferase LipB [Deltaproteobacteria bacterium]RLB35707.1 MAG: octanoyltransferase [Deltaproteobacteria bacterium]
MSSEQQKWLLADLGLLDYRKAHRLQLELLNYRKEGSLQEDIILLLEHPPVFTLGRRGGLDSLKVPRELLETRGIPVIQVERGGDITYHGPGQLVAYLIVNLRQKNLRVVEFVEALEEVMIRTVASWGIRAERNPLNRGAWVGMLKIGSIGIAVSRSFTYHGLALNVNADMEPFSWINPCGLHGVMMTSMEQVLGEKIPMEEVKNSLSAHFQDVFNIHLENGNHILSNYLPS